MERMEHKDYKDKEMMKFYGNDGVNNIADRFLQHNECTSIMHTSIFVRLHTN